MTRPFDISAWGRSVDGQYPIESFQSWVGDAPDSDEIKRFIRLGIFQGIPYAFKQQPMLFEHIRDFLSDRLDIDASQISMRGSGRLGFSLTPAKAFRPYNLGISDIDLFIVSDMLFDSLVAEALTGLNLWRNGELLPSLGTAKKWENNEPTIARHIKREFFDTNKVIVYRPKYIPKIKLLCDVTVEKINKELNNRGGFGPHAIKFIRVYRTWEAAMRQNLINIKSAFAP